MCRITPSFITENGITVLNANNPDKEYQQVLFDYIHRNPVKANIVVHETEWEYSSAKEYAGLKNKKLINNEIAKEYVVW